MADMISKLKTVALIGGAALLVVACGEKAAAPAADVTVTTTEAAPADVMAAPATDAAAADAMAAPAADAMAAPADATATTTTTTTEVAPVEAK